MRARPDAAQRGGSPGHGHACIADGVKVPRTHPQCLAAAGPMEQVVAHDHADQSGAVDIDPGARGCRFDGPTMIQEYGAGGERDEQRGHQHAVVQQCAETATESGTRAADHQCEGAGFSRAWFWPQPAGAAAAPAIVPPAGKWHRIGSSQSQRHGRLPSPRAARPCSPAAGPNVCRR